MDLWTCGLVDLRTCGPVSCGQNIYIMYVIGSVDLCGPVDLWTCGLVDLRTCELWEEYLYHVCNRKCGPLWTCG